VPQVQQNPIGLPGGIFGFELQEFQQFVNPPATQCDSNLEIPPVLSEPHQRGLETYQTLAKFVTAETGA
jgi:hypothetical protein